MGSVTSPHVPKAAQLGHSSNRHQRVEMALGLLVLGGVVAAAVTAYFLMPVDEVQARTAWRSILLTLLAIGLLTALYVVMLRRIAGSRRPVLMALSLVVVLFLGVVLVFAYIYLSMQTRSPGQVPGLVTHLDSLYFTVTMIATVGFGDIAPTGQAARAVATVQMTFNLVFLGFLVRSAFQVGQHGFQRRVEAETPEPDGGTSSDE